MPIDEPRAAVYIVGMRLRSTTLSPEHLFRALIVIAAVGVVTCGSMALTTFGIVTAAAAIKLIAALVVVAGLVAAVVIAGVLAAESWPLVRPATPGVVIRALRPSSPSPIIVTARPLPRPPRLAPVMGAA